MNEDQIPEELKETSQWVCWRYEERDGKPTKVPINPLTGARASTTGEKTWTDFETAKTYFENHPNAVDGIGFVFAETNLFAGVDLDDCRNPETGELDDWAKDAMEQLDSYTEYSPSGTGLHILVKGVLPGDRNRTGNIEMYDKHRFFTMTGDHVPGTEQTIHVRAEPLKALYTEYFKDDEPSEPAPTPQKDLDLDDEDLLDIAMQDDKFERLWRGDTAAYNDDHSRADMALCTKLAFYTQGDASHIEQLFTQSGLIRDKWRQREDYRERTINKAIQLCTDYYEPGTTEEPPKPEPFVDSDGEDTNEQHINWEGFDNLFNKARKKDSNLNKTEVDAQLADALLEKYDFKTPIDNEILWVFTNPVYERTGEQFINEVCRTNLKTHLRKTDITEIIENLKAHTYLDRPNGRELAHIIPLQNGYYDLGDDEFKPPNPDYFLTNEIPVTYDPNAACPEIKAFLRDIVNEDYLPTLQEIFGYLLYKDYPIAKAVMLLGSGKNGKSQLLELMRRFIGNENVAPTSLQKITESSFAAAQLYGKLANICGDLDARELPGTGEFKTLTGGDLVEAERKYERAFSFYNYAKLIYSANQLPKTPDSSDAFFRRWIVLEFPHRFTENPDPDNPQEKPKTANIVDQITTEKELSGLFNWALEGLKRLLDNGEFTVNDSMEAVKRKWLAQTNPLEVFVEEFVDVDTDQYVTTDEFYTMYERFCEMHGAPIQNSRWVGRKLKELVPQVVKTRKRVLGGEREYCYENIAIRNKSLKTNPDSSPDDDDRESNHDRGTTSDDTDKNISSSSQRVGNSLSQKSNDSETFAIGSKNSENSSQSDSKSLDNSDSPDTTSVSRGTDSHPSRDDIVDGLRELNTGDGATVETLADHLECEPDWLEERLNKLSSVGDVYEARGGLWAPL